MNLLDRLQRTRQGLARYAGNEELTEGGNDSVEKQKMLFFEGVNEEMIENKGQEKIRTGIHRRAAVERAANRLISH